MAIFVPDGVWAGLIDYSTGDSAGGYRSSVVASLLRKNGFADVSDILGGNTAWEQAVQSA